MMWNNPRNARNLALLSNLFCEEHQIYISWELCVNWDCVPHPTPDFSQKPLALMQTLLVDWAWSTKLLTLWIIALIYRTGWLGEKHQVTYLPAETNPTYNFDS